MKAKIERTNRGVWFVRKKIVILLNFVKQKVVLVVHLMTISLVIIYQEVSY